MYIQEYALLKRKFKNARAEYSKSNYIIINIIR